jgi:hypothetical protein
MFNRRTFLARIAALTAAGAAGSRLWAELPPAFRKPTPITVYKSSSCGCCAKWVDHVRSTGFAPEVYDREDVEDLKDELGVPRAVRSCHTAVCDQYLIEGHVPASDSRRLLNERPKVAGLAVPGMPPRTYGMAPPGVEVGGYEVLAFEADGKTRLFARH